MNLAEIRAGLSDFLSIASLAHAPKEKKKKKGNVSAMYSCHNSTSDDVILKLSHQLSITKEKYISIIYTQTIFAAVIAHVSG